MKNNSIPIISSNLHLCVDKKGNFYIELRRVFNDPQIIKLLISSALNDSPTVISLSFKNKHIAICNLVDKGIMKLDDKKQKYEFTF